MRGIFAVLALLVCLTGCKSSDQKSNSSLSDIVGPGEAKYVPEMLITFNGAFTSAIRSVLIGTDKSLCATVGYYQGSQGIGVYFNEPGRSCRDMGHINGDRVLFLSLDQFALGGVRMDDPNKVGALWRHGTTNIFVDFFMCFGKLEDRCTLDLTGAAPKLILKTEK